MRAADSALSLRVITGDDWQLWRALRLRALEDAPYAFNSSLASWRAADESKWRQRLTSGLHLVALREQTPVGMGSGMLEGQAVDILSMWVAPEARGRGVLDALLSELGHWARANQAQSLTLAVKADNQLAIRAYARNGFVRRGRLRNGDLKMVGELT